jgi:hypothetical protein
MKKIDNVKIDSLLCYEVQVSKHFHGPSHRPRVSAKIGFRVGDWPCGSADVNDVDESDEVQEAANRLIEAIESTFLTRVAETEELSEEKVNEKIKGLINQEI